MPLPKWVPYGRIPEDEPLCLCKQRQRAGILIIDGVPLLLCTECATEGQRNIKSAATFEREVTQLELQEITA